MSNQLQRLAMMHAALVPEIKALAERFADALALVEALGHQINAALASSDDAPRDESCVNPTTRVFDSDYLRETLELPMCAECTRLIGHNRWSVIKECVFRTDDMPEGFFWLTTYSEGATESQSEEPWEYVDEVKATLVRRGTKTIEAWIPTTMPEPPAQTFDQLGGFGFDRGPEPVIPEMAVHVPSTVPPPVETNEIGAIVQAVELSPVRFCEKECVLMENHAGVCVNGDGAEIHVIPDEPMSFAVSHDGVNATIAMGAKPKRAKTEYTAKEWGDSMHFLTLMKRQHPFNTWTAEQQNAKRDEFVASVPADERMNRWGQRFAKFCGVVT